MKINTLVSTAVLICFSFKAYSLILLDDVMSKEEQKKIGIYNLKAQQKKELEKWLNTNFTLKTEEAKKVESIGAIYLSLNVNNGERLIFSDGSIYEVDPQYRYISALWIQPLSFHIGLSNDPNYPYLVTNDYTQTGVNAKLIQPPTKKAEGSQEILPINPSTQPQVTPSPTVPPPMPQTPQAQPQPSTPTESTSTQTTQPKPEMGAYEPVDSKKQNKEYHPDKDEFRDEDEFPDED